MNEMLTDVVRVSDDGKYRFLLKKCDEFGFEFVLYEADNFDEAVEMLTDHYHLGFDSARGHYNLPVFTSDIDLYQNEIQRRNYD